MRKTSIWACVAAAIFCAIAIAIVLFVRAKSAQSAQEVFAAVAASVVVVFALDEAGEQIGQGSGVVVSENKIVTNCHVIADARAVAVRQAADSHTYLMGAQMIARDEERDLCLLFVSELSLPPQNAVPATAGRARDLSIGDEVFAVGAPRGLDLSLTRGIVSQLRGDFGKQSAPLIQTNAAISPGSSGGGLFNKDGKLVGITTLKRSGKNNEGLSFSMPSELVAELQAQAQAAKEIAVKQELQKCLSPPMVDCLFEIAFRTVDKIDYPSDHASALRHIAAAQAEAGLFPNAVRTAERLESTRFDHMISHVDALIDIAAAFAEAGHGVDAKNTFTNAVRVAEKIDRPIWLASNLRDIAVAQAKAGLFPNALRTAEKIEDTYDRAFALREIAAAQAEAGLFPNALRIAEKIEYSSALTSADIAAVQAKAGFFLNALQTAEKIKDADDRASALIDIAVSFAEAGHSVDAKNTFTNAVRTAEKIEDTDDRALSLRKIAAAQAEADFFSNALRTIEKIEYGPGNASASTDIAAVQAKAGLFLNALQTAEKIKDADDRASTLIDIATAFAKAGYSVDAKKTFANALRIAEKIEDAYDRASILSNIAIAQAEVGDIKNAIETSAKIDDENLFLHIRTLARIAVALAKTL